MKVYNEHLISRIGLNEMCKIVEREDDIIANEEKVIFAFLTGMKIRPADI